MPTSLSCARPRSRPRSSSAQRRALGWRCTCDGCPAPQRGICCAADQRERGDVAMIAARHRGGVLLALQGLLPAIGAVLLIQLQLLLDCCDGEWRAGVTSGSPVGVTSTHRSLGDPRRRCRLRSACAPTAAGTSGAATPRSGSWWQCSDCSCTESRRSSPSHGRSPGGPWPRTPRRGRARASGLRRVRRALRRLPFIPRVVPWSSRPGARRGRGRAVAGDLVGSRTLLVASSSWARSRRGHLLAVLPPIGYDERRPHASLFVLEQRGGQLTPRTSEFDAVTHVYEPHASACRRSGVHPRL